MFTIKMLSLNIPAGSAKDLPPSLKPHENGVNGDSTPNGASPKPVNGQDGPGSPDSHQNGGSEKSEADSNDSDQDNQDSANNSDVEEIDENNVENNEENAADNSDIEEIGRSGATSGLDDNSDIEEIENDDVEEISQESKPIEEICLDGKASLDDKENEEGKGDSSQDSKSDKPATESTPVKEGETPTKKKKYNKRLDPVVAEAAEIASKVGEVSKLLKCRFKGR